MNPAAPTPGRRRFALAAVIAEMALLGLVLGIVFPLVSLSLEARGVDTLLIGLMGAVPALAVVLAGPFAPALAARLGTMRAMLIGTTVSTLALLALAATDDLAAWFVLRFLSGAAVTLPWMVSETWINALAREGARGRVIGLYSAALFLGLAAGPLLLQRIGIDGWPPFLAAGAAMLLSLVPPLLARRLAPAMPARAAFRLHRLVRTAPTVAGAALLAGFTEQAIYVLLPVYGLRAGLGQEVAVTLLSVLTLGAIVLQLPYGWLADRMDRRRLLLATALVSAACPLLLPSLLGSLAATWALIAVWGGAAVGFYTVGLALLGQRFGPAELATANAGFIVLYQFGSLFGPAVAGAAMDLWDPHGFALGLALVAVGYAAFGALRGWHRQARDEPDAG